MQKIYKIRKSKIFCFLQQWSPTPGSSPFATCGTSATPPRPSAPTNSSSPMLMTRVQRDHQQGKAAKFITYSCPPSDPDQNLIAEENFDEASSVASSRESRV